ncbi:unnamed protein product [Prorocentrum cordatum]|uniref:Uncharacterized protein n=1 Tax=Prorocentrum cordatum TaxID=2364126 RepID=A0ABN9XF23_9DINO|nr:unnamed protein product [Polarella glacialis]
MLAVGSRHRPVSLASESDADAGPEHAPRGTCPAAPWARAAAAALAWAAAALALRAAAGRRGASARAAAGAWREAIVEASDRRRACVLDGGLRVRRWGAGAAVPAGDAGSGATFVFEGALWLVRSGTVQIQASTAGRDAGQEDFANTLKEIAIGGSFLENNTLHISATGVTWHSADGQRESILTDMDSEWSNELVKATRDFSGEALQPDPAVAERTVVHLKLPNSVQLQIEQWPDPAGHYVNIKVTKPVENGEVGLCVDSAAPAVGVSTSESLFRAGIYTRSCSSVESEVPWPYGGCEGLPTEANMYSSSAIDNSFTCGSCGQNQFVDFLGKLATDLKDLKEEECSQGVIYGVAFGSKYEDMLDVPSEYATRWLLHLHQRCFFYFVTADNESENISLNRTSKSGLNILIPVPTSALPYKSMRRNTKLFKMYGGFIVFAFAKRLVWQDAKLFPMEVNNSWIGMMDYQKMFTENVEQHGTCASFRALPNHRVSMGEVRSDGPRFEYHCACLESADRPDVTDDSNTLRKQCDHYQQLDTENGRISLDSGLIDSAVILWDMRSNRCRDFNSQLSCTWLGEIQCFGDRDQVSFPEALRAVGVYEPSPVSPLDSDRKDKLFVRSDDPEIPLVHIGRTSCHWYNSNFSNNMYTCTSNPDAVAKAIVAKVTAANTSSKAPTSKAPTGFESTLLGKR